MFNKGHAIVTRSFISSNNGASGAGGGVHNEGMLILADTVIADNAADAGGGLGNSGSATITHSTVLWNTGTLTVTNSTISGSELGLVNRTGGNNTLIHSTIANKVGLTLCMAVVLDSLPSTA